MDFRNARPLSRDTDAVQFLEQEKARLTIVGVFPISRRPNLSSSSLEERSYKRAILTRDEAPADRGEYRQAAPPIKLPSDGGTAMRGLLQNNHLAGTVGLIRAFSPADATVWRRIMTTLKTLTIVTALLAGGVSLAMAQGPATGGYPPVAGGAAGNPAVPQPPGPGIIPHDVTNNPSAARPITPTAHRMHRHHIYMSTKGTSK
jgi:hypothetical protein